MVEIALPGLGRYIERVRQQEALTEEQRRKEDTERCESAEQTRQQRVIDSKYLKRPEALRILLKASEMMLAGGIENYVVITGVEYNNEPMQLKLSWDYMTVRTNSDFGNDWSWKEVNVGVERSKSGRVVGLRINSDPPKHEGFVTKLKPEILAEAIDKAFQEPVIIPQAGYPHWYEDGDNYWHVIREAQVQQSSI